MRVLRLAMGLIVNIAILVFGLVALAKHVVFERWRGRHDPEPEDDSSGAKVSNHAQRIPPGS